MTTIGTFTKSADGSFQGAIRTLALSLKSVEIRPVARTGESGPDHRIYAGAVDLGAAWTVTKPDKPECLSVRLDDPSFPAPVNALLAQAGGAYELRWSRRPRT
jgi:uncharacterized protein (DUF736 family)